MGVHRGPHHRADGRYPIYAFADADATALDAWAEWMLHAEESPLRRFTPEGADIDTFFDVKAIYQQEHHGVAIERSPKVFLPNSGPFQLVDYEKIYAAKPGEDIFELRGISRGGAVVIVRPDQYVANILPLEATQELADFLAPLFLSR